MIGPACVNNHNFLDKSLSIWDTFSHTRSEKILDRSNADVACDSYNLWETDVALAKALGIQFYRQSRSNKQPYLDPSSIFRRRGVRRTLEKHSIYAHPIFAKDGGWPPSIEQFVAKKSKKEGYKKSRLPAFTREEIEFIKGTYDFYGLNYYTARLASPIPPNMSVEMPGWLDGNLELGLVYKPDPKWKEGYAWLVSYPPGLRKQINWLVKQYGDMEIRIFENGYSTPDSVDVDSNRIDYLEDHLEQVLLSIHEDGHNVTAFTAWALMDNYEWSSGFKSRFGLAAVDFTDPKRKRTPRASFAFYAAVIASHSLDFY
ncbi:unnamed protein product [Leptosia nina]|uniref:Uncharacterized protein n=1 Tax=Leptosia nina TaxID=320188 RepID=A0AAV1J6T6_9NEOP